MAKRTQSKNTNATRGRSRQPKPRKTALVRSLDAAGAAYARLLADPCNAPLAHPVYSGSEGGYLVRGESFVTFNVGANQNCGAVVFTPSAIGSTDSEVLVIGPTGPTVDAVMGGVGDVLPCKPFLTANASTCRVVAACMKVSYPGSESSRSGRVHFGQASGGLAPIGTTTTVDKIAQALPHYCRTPAQEIELVWKPNDADQLMRDPNGPTAQQDNERRAALVCAWAGFPPSTGLTFRFTVVWEWQPDNGKGLSVPNLSKSPSNNTLDEVVNYLVSQGFRFVGGVGTMLGSGIANGIINTTANAFGMMPSRVVTRSSRNFLN